MHTVARNIALLVVFGFLTGCTHSLYHAELDTLNSEGGPRKSVLYWSKTNKLIGDAKAGPILLMTACSTRRIHFAETEIGIVFRGSPGQDRIPGQSGTVTDGAICGKIQSGSKITDLHAGPLLLTVSCEAMTDEFSARTGLFSPSYLQARESSYQFEVQEVRSWSVWGRTPDAPEPPACP
jgi:hypothetical protein